MFFLYGGSRFRAGKFRKYLDSVEADRLYDDVLNILANGGVVRNMGRVDGLLVELELYLSDPLVPRCFEKWLTLKGGAKKVLAVSQGDADDQPS